MPSGRTSIECAGSKRFTPSKKVSSPSSCTRNRRKRRSASTAARRARILEQRLQLGREREAGRAVDVVERLDAEAVTREEELAAFVIRDGEREHTGEVVDNVATPL